MKPGKITAALCAGLALVLGCSPASVERSYVAQAIDSLHHYSLHQARLDKDSLLRAALEDLTDTSTRAHSHAILRELVRSIDRHSDLFSPGQVRGELEPLTKNTDLYPFQHRLLDGDIALIRVDGFMQGDSLSCGLFADSLQRAVLALHERAPIGWIVDLRANTGGNLYPMLAGLGPLLGCGDLGWNVDASGLKQAWWYCRDDDEPEGSSHITLVSEPVVFNDTPPVVVLVGQHTGSAGEALALSFVGRSRTCSFGARTAGYASGNRMVFLRDSALLNVTCAWMMDRSGRTHPHGMIPDSLFEREEDAFRAAEEFLLTWRERSSRIACN